jgi:deoxyribose-phosphate aldolase
MVEDDIRSVVEAAGAVPVKVILEICYLTDDEIRRASEIGVKAGAAYIKTGTGWGPKPTTVETIRLIRQTIGDAALIKAAGGVRSLDILLEMEAAGCNRFGIGVRSAISILHEAYARAGIEIVDDGKGVSAGDLY